MNTLSVQRPSGTAPSTFLPGRGLLLRRKCACGSGAGASGECEACRSKKRLQTKLAIGASNDPLEQEADRIADQVLAAPAHAAVNSVPPRIQRFAGQPTGEAAMAPSSVDHVLAGSGRSLEPALRQDMERRFGHDFSRVRVHADAAAERSARDVSAHAYTVGHNIVFGAGRFVPGTQVGRRLIAHELTHVVQQSGAAGNRADQGRNINGPTPHLPAYSSSCGPLLQRHKDDLVAYSGGQSGFVQVIKAGRWIYTANAVSGHPGRGENEPGSGPIPSGRYVMHPGVTRATVATMQSGTCGANPISSGYQAITSTDAEPCEVGAEAHYCNVPCQDSDGNARKCYTPKDCWGSHRIKIEGGKEVVTPSGKHRVRSGFYLHGGNPADAVSSGCVKSLDDGVFTPIRTLTGVEGAVPFCVGATCAPAVRKAFETAVVETLAEGAQRAKEREMKNRAPTVGERLGEAARSLWEKLP